jgi:hypothetical protein
MVGNELAFLKNSGHCSLDTVCWNLDQDGVLAVEKSPAIEPIKKSIELPLILHPKDSLAGGGMIDLYEDREFLTRSQNLSSRASDDCGRIRKLQLVQYLKETLFADHPPKGFEGRDR